MRRFIAAAALLLFTATRALAGDPYAGIVVFGDSLSDNGNVWEATRTGLATRRPGPPWYSTGRFTDGADNTIAANRPTLQVMQAGFTGTWHERLADDLGIPRATAMRPSGSTGTNFAHGGATTADGDDGLNIVWNMGMQVQSYFGRFGSDTIPTNQLYILWGGGNDLRAAGLAQNATAASCSAAAQTAVTNIQNLIIRLSQHTPPEARLEVLWPNVPPIQSIPEFLALNQGARDAVQAGCEAFRDQQITSINDLRTQAPNVTVRRMDIYGLFGDMLAGRLDWTPANSTQNIVNAGNFSGLTFNPTRNAAVPNGIDPDTYVYWDQVHPTSRVHQLIGDYALTLLPEPGAVVLIVVGLLGVQHRRRAA
jgi:phospholipase/lecithinase/hemolysin